MAAILSIAERLDAAQRDFLDLGLRNTLFNYRLTKSRGVQVTEATSAEVAQWLLADRRSLEFVPSESAKSEPGPGESIIEATSKPAPVTTHDDKNLQARLLTAR